MVESTQSNEAERLAAIGINEGKIKGILKKKDTVDRFMKVIDLSGITSCPKEKGALLEAVAMKIDPNLAPYTKDFAQQIAKDKWTKALQIEEAIKWLSAKVKKNGEGYKLDIGELDKATGVGVVVTQE